jgi:hypothetical protein
MLTIALLTIAPISALMLVALTWHTAKGQNWLTSESERHALERMQELGMIASVKEFKLPVKAEAKKAA